MNLMNLTQLIADDAEAKTLAEAGRDAECAALLSSKHTEPAEYRLTLLTVLDKLGFSRGAAIIAALRLAAAGNAALAELLAWMEAGRPGVNVAHPDAATVFGQLVAGQILTADEADQLLSLGKRPVIVTADQVSAAWADRRPEGKVQDGAA